MSTASIKGRRFGILGFGCTFLSFAGALAHPVVQESLAARNLFPLPSITQGWLALEFLLGLVGVLFMGAFLRRWTGSGWKVGLVWGMLIAGVAAPLIHGLKLVVIRTWTLPEAEFRSPMGKRLIQVGQWGLGFAGGMVMFQPSSSSGPFLREKFLELPVLDDVFPSALKWSVGEDMVGVYYHECVPKDQVMLCAGYDFVGRKVVFSPDWPARREFMIPPLVEQGDDSVWNRLVQEMAASTAVEVPLR
jgi:hypothetical protein